MKMYKRKNLGIIILCLFILSFGATRADANMDPELQALYEFEQFFHEENIEVDSWQLLLREHIVTQDPEGHIKIFFGNHPYEIKETEQAIKYFSKNTQKKNGISVQLSIVQEKENQNSLQLFYTLKGDEIAGLDENFLLKTINRAKSHFFAKNPSVFTCMIGNSSDNIKIKTITKNFHEKFNLNDVKWMTESNFSTVSGYSPDLFVKPIPMSNTEQMNVQLAVRNVATMGTKLTIGTPILTVEY